MLIRHDSLLKLHAWARHQTTPITPAIPMGSFLSIARSVNRVKFPDFIGRALEHMRSASVDGDFTFEHVDFEVAAVVWLAPIGAYEPAEDTPSTTGEVAAGASPTGPYGRVMLDYEIGVRCAMLGARRRCTRRVWSGASRSPRESSITCSSCARCGAE